MKTLKDCELPEAAAEVVYRVAIAADAVVHIVFEKLAAMSLAQSQRVAGRIKDETGDLNAEPRMLYDFREIATWDDCILLRLTSLFSALATHAGARGAFLAASDAQFIDLYTVCILRDEGQHGQRAIFRNESAALTWLSGSD